MTGPQIPIGTFVAGGHGEPLGHVGAVYVDNATGRPAWAAVRGRRHSAVVPLELSRFDGATLHIPFDAEQLRTAPVHNPDTLISYEQGDELARHYGLLARSSAAVESPTDPGNPAMTRSEERMRTRTVNVVVGRARLETYIVTENRTFVVPVRRQEVRLVYDALPDDEQVVSDAGPREDVREVVLHTEQVRFTSQVVPVERVRMVRRVHTTERAVTAELRSERIETEHTRRASPGPR
jgi:stress response protein YsnF